MKIITAQTKFANDIAVLYSGLNESMGESAPNYFKKAEQSIDYINEIISEADSDFIIAVDNNKVIGFALVESKSTPPFDCFVPHKYTYLMDLFVDKSYRKQGIAKALMAAVKQWANEHEADFIELTVMSNNDNAISLYEGLGYNDFAKRMRLKL